jgi:hypothetical protein
MSTTSRLVFGAMLGTLGVLSLYGASMAKVDSTLYYAGLGLFALCVIQVLRMVKATFDEAERRGLGRP